MKTENARGKIFYGMHFYPGVAEYNPPDASAFRIFINEDTIRNMDPSFAGCPVFVAHVDGVDPNIDELKKDADGWVVESFYNEADGKHWAKFVVVSERAERAIRNGMRLSNCYIPSAFSNGGTWNGVEYAKQVLGGQYEHLAIVPNPRYEESVIMTPDEFKKYNEDKVSELKRLSNDNNGKGERMKLTLFKRTKVENAVDLTEMAVVLPKSGREVSILQLVNEMDEHEAKKKEPQMANGEHQVEVGGSKMTVNELLAKHKLMCDEMEKMKSAKEPDDVEADHQSTGVSPTSLEDAIDDEAAKKKAVELAEHEEAEIMAAKKKENEDEEEKKKKEAEEKTKNAKEKAERLRNAHTRDHEESDVTICLSDTMVARGKARYGS